MIVYRVEQKNPAKFGDTCSVRADGLCIGSPRLVGRERAGTFKHAGIFLHDPVYDLRTEMTRGVAKSE